MKRLFLYSMASLVLASPVAAQDFDGFRVEGRLGYDAPQIEGHFDDPITSITEDSTEGGFGIGAEAGYDFVVSPGFVLGGYIGADFSDADFCTKFGRIENACLEVRRNLYLGARAGAQVASSTLLYGKVGYSNGQAKADLDDLENILGDIDETRTLSGIHFGLGVEQNFGSNVYGKLEYVYTAYRDKDFGNAIYNVNIDSDRSQFMAGVGYRF
jgi:outer membrane immunogenic protein